MKDRRKGFQRLAIVPKHKGGYMKFLSLLMAFLLLSNPILSSLGLGSIEGFGQDPVPPLPPGDANGDGEINILDVTVILNDILEIAPAPGNGDCNNDGAVNILDVTCVLNIILEITPPPEESPAPEIIDVSMTDELEFVPPEVTIKVGDTVRWTNTGEVFPHTTQDDDGTIWNSNDEFPLPNYMEPGDVFEFTFTEEGSLPYFCLLHGGPAGIGMAGTVTVEP